MAAIAEPLTISLHGLHRAELKAGEHILISGAGPIGLVAGLIAQVYGAHAIISDPVEARLEEARALGIGHTINSTEEDPAEMTGHTVAGISRRS